MVVSQFVASMLAGALDEQHAFSGIGEHPGDDVSSGARPDDDGVIMFRGSAQVDFGQRIGFDGNHAFWQGREPDFEQSQLDLTRSN